MLYQHTPIIALLLLSSTPQTFGYSVQCPPLHSSPRRLPFSPTTSLYSSYNQNDNSETLYDMLEIDSSATSVEIKKQYFTLAKHLHPDAQRNLSTTSDSTVNNSDRFVEVSTAYKILSDPLERKRYDRSLQAEAFTQDVEKAAADVSRRAAPYVKELFQNVAAPLFRRTGATTKAFLDAATDDTEQEMEFTKRVESILTATNQAGKAVDRLLLLEKSRELRRKCLLEQQESQTIRKRWEDVKEARLMLGLKIPQAPLTSDEAHYLLNALNTTDSKSILDYALLKNTAHNEIDLFQQSEQDFLRKVKLQDLIEEDYRHASAEFEMTKQMEQRAIQDVKRLQRELTNAQHRVLETRTHKTQLWQNVTALEEAKRRSHMEAERASYNVEKRRGLVKNVLVRKDKENEKRKLRILQQTEEYDRVRNGNATNIASLDNTTSSEEAPMLNDNNSTSKDTDTLDQVDLMNLSPTMEDFAFLKKQETLLKFQCSRSEDRAARLRSRSELLRKQSELLQQTAKTK